MARLSALVLVLATATGGARADERRLWPEKFAAARPRRDAPAALRVRPSPPVASKAVKAPPAPAAVIGPTRRDEGFLGVSLWLVKPAPAGAPVWDFQAELADSGRALNDGARVRLSFESSRAGYLYVIDREAFADGTLGKPVLLFPTTRLRGGDNRVAPGRVVELPDQRDQPPYFSLRRGQPGHVGETILALVSERPLADVPAAPQPVTLDPQQVAEWERLAVRAETRYDVPARPREYSSSERDAGGPQARALVHTDPPPQTLYRLDAGASGLAAVQVELRLTPGAEGR